MDGFYGTIYKYYLCCVIKKYFMEKLNVSQEIRQEIIDKYNSGITIRKIRDQYIYSFTFIQKLIHSFEYDQQIATNYPQLEDHYMVAICKQTNKELKDYKNESGAIAEHTFKLYPEESKKSKYIRKSKEYSTGKFWYDDYFTFEYRKVKDIKKCHYCDWTTEDVANLSGAYEKHLLNIHNIIIDNHVKEYKEDIGYFKKITPEDAIVCKICGKKLKMLNHKHLHTHNISVDEYKIKFGELIVSPTTHEKLMKAGKHANNYVVKSKTSKPENEIKDFLRDNNINIVQSTRKFLNGFEIDLYSLEYKMGIEYNGNLYHTELFGKKEYGYHLNKTKIALENGIMLYHIHEDEWELHKDIVKNKLLYLFNKCPNKKIHARKCKLSTISNIEKSEFLKENHIQGDDKSTHFIGAYYDDVLYVVMTFSNVRYMNKEKNHNERIFELTRFAIKNNYIISGIGNRLLKFFLKKYSPIKIFSFADRRWTPSQTDNLYTKMGFTCVEILKPDYSYYNRKAHRCGRLHKFGFGKSSIKKRYPEVYNENKTEWEMMQELGYDRIWDCGKFKYELNFNNET